MAGPNLPQAARRHLEIPRREQRGGRRRTEPIGVRRSRRHANRFLKAARVRPFPFPHTVTSISKRRILIVDDDPGVTKLCRYVLEGTGEFTVEAESNGRCAAEAATRVQPHLVLLDRHLPGIDGFAIADAFASDPALASLPVLMITGDIESVSVRGKHPVLLKPLRAAEIIEACMAWAMPPSE